LTFVDGRSCDVYIEKNYINEISIIMKVDKMGDYISYSYNVSQLRSVVGDNKLGVRRINSGVVDFNAVGW